MFKFSPPFRLKVECEMGDVLSGDYGTTQCLAILLDRVCNDRFIILHNIKTNCPKEEL